MTRLNQKFRSKGITPFSLFIAVIAILVLQGCSSAQLQPWHTEKLTEEFTEEKADEVKTFDDYLALEDRLFKQLDEKVYSQSETGPEFRLDRYSPGSAADSRKLEINWNRRHSIRKDTGLLACACPGTVLHLRACDTSAAMTWLPRCG